MKKFGEFICKHKIILLIITGILFILSLIGINLTKINYDILVYLPDDIETIQGQNILTDEFEMGAFSIVVANNTTAKDILHLEKDIRSIKGVNKVLSLYDIIGTDIPKEYLPQEIKSKLVSDEYDLLLITFNESTSSESTLKAIEEIRKLSHNKMSIGGMSSMVLDTMQISNKEMPIYILIAVILCLIVLIVSLDSYIVPFLLLGNIGIALIFNLGTNFFLGDISYITKALVAVLQLGVTTDFSIFLYHSYEENKTKYKDINEAMAESIKETFTSVSASSITTIAGFLVLCLMQLKLGTNLGLVMAKGVFLGVISVITIFPALLLVFNKQIEKTKHKSIIPNFNKLNKFIIKNHVLIFILFIFMIIPTYLTYKKVDTYYKIDESLPKTLESIKTNKLLKEKFNIASPEIIIIDSKVKPNNINKMIDELDKIDGVDFVLSGNLVSEMGIDIEYLPDDIKNSFKNQNYQLLMINSLYDIATDELNNQTKEINKIIKKYDENAILAGEGPLMKDLIKISDKDFTNVNVVSIVCILVIMLIALKSFSLPVLLISAIEFAIFTNMGISYLQGDILPFIAPIVLGTIQLGSTIDYAILLTTNYLNERKNNNNKLDAMLKTSNLSINSIIVSSLCFFGATIGVGLYSKIDLVGAICKLISRGAIISMLSVIFILPSILLIFDNLINKTTFKKEKNMKKLNKKIATWAILILQVSTVLPVNALTKNETVYSKIDASGNVIKTTVTEKLINDNDEVTLNDLTDLENINNISNDKTFKLDNTNLTWNAQKENIIYKGITNKSLPLDIKLTYKLNGEDIKLSNLLGKKGHIDINLKYTNNEKNLVYLNGRNTYLYTPFIVTLGTVIKEEGNDNFYISNGKIINNGLNNILIAVASPGLNESLGRKELEGLNNIHISYDTENFELPAIYNIVSTELLDNNNNLIIFNKLDSVISKLSLLKTNMDAIEEGSDKLLEASAKLESGSSLIHDNIAKISSKVREINTGVGKIDETLTDILNTLINTNDIIASGNKDGISKVENLIKENIEKLDKLIKENEKIKEEYEKENLINLSYEDIIKLDNHLKLYDIKYKYENNYDDNQVLIDILNHNKETLLKLLEVLENIKNEIDKMLPLVNSSLEQIKNNSNNLANGVNDLSNGLNILTDKTNDLHTGTASLNTGIDVLNQGIKKYNSEGITPLINTISNNVSYNITKLKKLNELASNYDTFTMKNQEDEGNTKFIIILDGQKKEIEKTISNKKIEKTTFVERVKNIFK